MHFEQRLPSTPQQNSVHHENLVCLRIFRFVAVAKHDISKTSFVFNLFSHNFLLNHTQIQIQMRSFKVCVFVVVLLTLLLKFERHIVSVVGNIDCRT